MTELKLMQVKEIFKAQRTFNEKVIQEWTDIEQWDFNLKNKWINRQFTAFMIEMVELIDSTHWKWWKKYNNAEDIQNVHVEIVDMLHFLVSIYQILGDDGVLFFKHWNSCKYIAEYKDNIHDEFSEMIKSSGNFFKNTNPEYILTSFIGLCKKYNLTEEELYNKYFAKMQVNLNRQANNYSDTNKDPNDCKHI